MKCRKCKEDETIYIWGKRYCPSCIEQQIGFSKLLKHREYREKFSLKSSVAVTLGLLIVFVFAGLFYLVSFYLFSNTDAFAKGIIFINSINISLLAAGIVISYVDSGNIWKDVLILAYVLVFFTILSRLVTEAGAIELLFTFAQSIFVYPLMLLAGVFAYKFLTR